MRRSKQKLKYGYVDKTTLIVLYGILLISVCGFAYKINNKLFSLSEINFPHYNPRYVLYINFHRLRMKSATQDRYGPDGLGSRTGGFRQKRPDFRYGPDKTDLGHSGSDRTDPSPTLGQTKPTQDQPRARPKRPKTNTGPEEKDPRPTHG